MSQTLIFNESNTLDFYELRLNVIRIPEVMSRIRMAQKIWDRHDLPDFDIHNYLISEDKIFLNKPLIKSLIASIVQVGLFDRYLKNNSCPIFFVSQNSNTTSIQSCIGKLHFKDLIIESPAVKMLKIAIEGDEASEKISDDLISLSSSQKIEEKVYTLYERVKVGENQKYVKVHFESNKSLVEIIRFLVDEKKNKNFINVGPAPLTQELKREFEIEDLYFSEVVDGDPMLNWFWSSLSQVELSVAQ